MRLTAQSLLLFVGLIGFEVRTRSVSALVPTAQRHQLYQRRLLRGSVWHKLVVMPKDEESMHEVSACPSWRLCNDDGYNYNLSISSGLYPRSVFFTLADAATSPIDGFAPGTVVLSIKTKDVKKWFSTNTAALLHPNGQACVVDDGPETPATSQNWEWTAYSVVDGSHIRLVLKKPHILGATLVVGDDGCQFEPGATP